MKPHSNAKRQEARNEIMPQIAFVCAFMRSFVCRHKKIQNLHKEPLHRLFIAFLCEFIKTLIKKYLSNELI